MTPLGAEGNVGWRYYRAVKSAYGGGGGEWTGQQDTGLLPEETTVCFLLPTNSQYCFS